jgi:hypothetical protein
METPSTSLTTCKWDQNRPLLEQIRAKFPYIQLLCITSRHHWHPSDCPETLNRILPVCLPRFSPFRLALPSGWRRFKRLLARRKKPEGFSRSSLAVIIRRAKVTLCSRTFRQPVFFCLHLFVVLRFAAIQDCRIQVSLREKSAHRADRVYIHWNACQCDPINSAQGPLYPLLRRRSLSSSQGIGQRSQDY